MLPHRQQSTRLLRPWDSPGKNTGVGCHCLLQCMKVKSESEVSRVRLLATPWTAAYQAPPSMGFSRQEYWSGVPLPSLRYCLYLSIWGMHRIFFYLSIIVFSRPFIPSYSDLFFIQSFERGVRLATELGREKHHIYILENGWWRSHFIKILGTVTSIIIYYAKYQVEYDCWQISSPINLWVVWSWETSENKDIRHLFSNYHVSNAVIENWP